MTATSMLSISQQKNKRVIEDRWTFSPLVLNSKIWLSSVTFLLPCTYRCMFDHERVTCASITCCQNPRQIVEPLKQLILSRPLLCKFLSSPTEWFHLSQQKLSNMSSTKAKLVSSLPSYSLNVLMIIMIAIAFTNWKGCRNYRCHYAQYLGTYRATFCPGARPAMVKPPPSGSVMGNYSSAAIAVDGEPCAQVGM